MKKKIIITSLAFLSIFTILLNGCSNKEEIPNGPDYSDSTKQFDFYGYSACINGWNIDGIKYDSKEDNLSVDRIKEYMDCGMTIYFPQVSALVNDEAVSDWENSSAKRALDYANEAGIGKVILVDSRIQSLTKVSFGTDAEVKAMIANGTIYDNPNYGLVGEGKQFATEDDLDAFVASCMAPYKDHEAFYGIMLGDEPYFYHAKSYGEMYRSIKRVCPDAYIQYNLNPPSICRGDRYGFASPKVEDETGKSENDLMIESYRMYLSLFMEETGADYVQYDAYPLYYEGTIDDHYIVGLQVAAEVAQKYNANFYFVTQTFNRTDGGAKYRNLGDADYRWLNNMLLGFGIKRIAYFTYFTKADNNSEHFKDGQSFLTWEGERTDTYYYMQQIMKENQLFAPVILNFKYNTSKIFRVKESIFSTNHAVLKIETPDFVELKNVNVNKEIALVTELYDSEKDNYLYMFQNIIDPHQKGSKAFQTIEATFSNKYQYAAIYVNGEKTLVKLDDGVLVIKQKPGEATFVMPY